MGKRLRGRALDHFALRLTPEKTDEYSDRISGPAKRWVGASKAGVSLEESGSGFDDGQNGLEKSAEVFGAGRKIQAGEGVR